MSDELQRGECPTHGAFEARPLAIIGRLRCPTCEQERRAQDEAEQAARDRAWRAQMRRQRIDAYLSASNLVGRFRAATFDSYVPSNDRAAKVLQACRDFAEDVAQGSAPGGGLILIGPPGTGKTHLAAAMALHVIEQGGKPAAVFTTREIVRALRATWSRESKQTEEQVLEDFDDLALLTIDEVGVGFGGESETTQLLEVIDRRYRLQRPTVIASNLNLPAIRDALGERAIDRLREGARTLVLDWPSHRRPA